MFNYIFTENKRCFRYLQFPLPLPNNFSIIRSCFLPPLRDTFSVLFCASVYHDVLEVVLSTDAQS